MNSDNAADKSKDAEHKEEAYQILDRIREQKSRELREEPKTKVHHSLHKTAKPPLKIQNRTMANRPQEQSHGKSY